MSELHKGLYIYFVRLGLRLEPLVGFEKPERRSWTQTHTLFNLLTDLWDI